CEHLGRVPARRPRLAEGVEARDVDRDALPHRLELGVGLHGAGEVVPGVPVDELRMLVERDEVARGHYIVEPVDADPLAAEPVGEPLAGPVGEDLLLDPGVAMLPDVARLRREDDRRLAVHGKKHVRVAVDDLEAGEVRHRALETRVLGAADERSVEVVPLESLTHPQMPRGQIYVHDASNPLMSAWIMAWRGVATPHSPPKRTMPPLR